MNKRPIIFRADGNSEIGLGHISRCCALMDIVQNHFECMFYSRAVSAEVNEFVGKFCKTIVETGNDVSYEEEAVKWVGSLKGDEIVVLDGYNFGTGYQSAIKAKGCKLVCIDDLHSFHFVADAVINHAPSSTASMYSAEPYTKLFLGTEYLVVKKVFLQQAGFRRHLDFESSPILICLGGADPANRTIEIVHEVKKRFPCKKLYVIVGAAYRYEKLLRDYVDNLQQVFFFKNTDPETMAGLMEEAHIAVTSASTVALEYCCIKGNLFLLMTAGNQVDIYHSLIEKKCAYPFEDLAALFNSGEMTSAQESLIDGKSPSRILEIFMSLSNDH